jgi:hypothetical protein
MKCLKIILAIVLVGINLSSFSQHKASGLLILSTWRDHTSFDLFVPGNIDKTKSLRANLAKLSDTAIRFKIYEDNLLTANMLKRAIKLVNESEVKGTNKDILVLVVEVEYEYEDYNVLLPKEIYGYDVVLYGKNIVNVYNNNGPFFKKLKVLKLPIKDAANTSFVK